MISVATSVVIGNKLWVGKIVLGNKLCVGKQVV